MDVINRYGLEGIEELIKEDSCAIVRYDPEDDRFSLVQEIEAPDEATCGKYKGLYYENFAWWLYAYDEETEHKLESMKSVNLSKTNWN